MTTATRYEVNELLEIVGNLPASRVEEVIDFARFLEWQLKREQTLSGIDAEDDSSAEHEAWDALFATEQSQQLLTRLAAQVLAEDEAGATFDLLLDADGNLID